jgi:hypothetical protein
MLITFPKQFSLSFIVDRWLLTEIRIDDEFVFRTSPTNNASFFGGYFFAIAIINPSLLG